MLLPTTQIVNLGHEVPIRPPIFPENTEGKHVQRLKSLKKKDFFGWALQQKFLGPEDRG
jgi:hypothetical protein